MLTNFPLYSLLLAFRDPSKLHGGLVLDLCLPGQPLLNRRPSYRESLGQLYRRTFGSISNVPRALRRSFSNSDVGVWSDPVDSFDAAESEPPGIPKSTYLFMRNRPLVWSRILLQYWTILRTIFSGYTPSLVLKQLLWGDNFRPPRSQVRHECALLILAFVLLFVLVPSSARGRSLVSRILAVFEDLVRERPS